MSGLLWRVQAFAAREGLWTPSSRVVAAVSGGSDSVALAWLMAELAGEGHLQLAGLAHLHHHIRGEAAEADARFVEELGVRLGIPVLVGHADVPALARGRGWSLEVAGRNARLAFFDEALATLNGSDIAVAHTRGDQAETVLLRLARGAGPRGLAGMAPRTAARIRPLLGVGRQELRDWLGRRGESWREDDTNSDLSVVRNHVRHVVLPALTAVNRRVEQAIARAARIQAADARLLDQLAREAAPGVIRGSAHEVVVDAAALARLPESLARRVALAALETLDPSRAYGWEAAEVVLGASAARVRYIGPVRMERIAGDVVLTKREPSSGRGPQPECEAVTVEVPGIARDPLGRWTVEVEGPVAPGAAWASALPSGLASETERAVLDAEALGRHLTVRAWRAGDRVQPLGLGGRKKVQDVFVDRKVPREMRASVPLVIDEQGRIAWVAGHVVGESFRVTPRSTGVVVLTLRR